MHCLSKLYTVLVILVMGLSMFDVDAKLPSTKVVGKPGCTGKSVNKGYDKYATHLVDFLVDQTKNVFRDKDGSYRYNHSYPDPSSGSANGMGCCGKKLEKLDCWSCLVSAKDKLKSACHRPVDANITLKDCSLSFNMIP
ncbi:hypothetical protein LINPERPRIM_LOCUS3998 [Linum perenne]